MKSKKKQRILALILSMVLMLSASISALAQGDVQTEASGTETTENQAAAQSLGEETVPETEAPAEEAGIATQSAEITEEPAEQETADQNTAEQGTTEQNTAEQEIQTQENPEASAQSQEAPGEAAETVQDGTSAAADNIQENTSEAETAPESEVQNTETQEEASVSEEQPAETTEETVTEETVVSEATELKQEFTDEDGNVTQTVTAYVPEGAFQATADQISMEVKLLNEEDTNYIKGMMEEKLPEGFYLDGYVLYQIDFKVNGEITKPAKAITISMTGNELAVEDTKNAHVFYYVPEDPEAEGDEDQLTEVTQKDQLIKSLEESGQSTENIEDYDYSEITVNEGNADTITVKGWESTIYGCYVEKEMAQEVTYEDDTVKVTVSADEKGIIPNKTTLQVVPISNSGDTKDQYKEVEKKLQEKAESEEYEIAGFLAYDISFVDKDGKEVEPDGEVRVSLEYKNAALPEGLTEEEAKEADVTMLHLEEDEKGEVQDVVDMAEKEQVEAIATTESQQVEKVAVKTESFSTFTIVWSKGIFADFNISVEYVDEDGEEITVENAPTDSIKLSGNQGTVDLNQYWREANGYTQDKICIEENEVKSLHYYTQSGLMGTSYYVKYVDSDDKEQNWLENGFFNSQEGTISFIYSTTGVKIEDHIIEAGTFDAVYQGDGEPIDYKWLKSDEENGTYTEVEQVYYENGASNLSENGSSLYPAYDEGARKWYKVVATLADGKTVESKPLQVPYYDELQNGSFERPQIGQYSYNEQYTNQEYANDGGVWQSTGVNSSKGNVAIEIVHEGRNNGQQMYSWYGDWDEAAPDGNQFAELNCEAAGALYQDVLTMEGTSLTYQLQHRARGGRLSWDPEYDTMYLVIMPTSLAIDEKLTTQEQLQRYLKNYCRTDITTKYFKTDNQITYEDKANGILVVRVTSDDQSWQTVLKANGYTPTSSLTRFFFVAGDTASGSNTVGNFLDDVWFSQKLPDVADDEFSIEIKKEFEGLDGTRLDEVQRKLQFEISAVNSAGKSLTDQEIEELFGASIINNTNWTEDPYGNITWAAANVKISPDESYTITITEENADLPEYQRETTSSVVITTEDEKGVPTEGNGSSATVTGLSGKQIAEVTFQNTYERSESKNITFNKKWDDADNKYNTRPASLDVTLVPSITVEESGQLVRKELTSAELGVELTQTLTSDNALQDDLSTWQTVWENVPVYYEYNGIPIKIDYTVTEGSTDGGGYVYEAANGGIAVSGDGSDYKMTVPGNLTEPDENTTTVSTKAKALKASAKSAQANEEGTALGEPTHNKYIEYDPSTGEYTLNLDVTGEKGEAKGADILFVIDTSGSMADPVNGSFSKSYLQTVKELLTGDDGIIDQIFAGEDNVNSVAYVSFAGKSETKNSGWYSKNNYSELESSINSLRATGGTNWTYAMQRASSVLAQKSYSDNEKIVIFLSDGEPTYTMDGRWQVGYGNYTIEKYYTDAINEVTGSASLNNAQFYSVYLTSGTKDGMKKFSDGLVKGGVNSQLKDGTILSTALDEILDQIIPTYENVTITDVLSQYVEFAENPEITVKVKYADQSREETLTKDSDYTLEQQGKTVQVTFKGEYEELADGATYTLSFKIKPSEEANKAYAEDGYLDRGDPGTGSTSANKKGFYSNDNDKTNITYSIKGVEGSDSASYPKPVIQVTTHTLSYEKHWEQPENEEPSKQDVTLKVGYSDGTTNEITLTADKDYKYTENVPVTKNIASVTEIDTDPDYTPSYQITENGTKVIITNSYTKITTKDIKVVKVYDESIENPPVVQVALYGSTNDGNAVLLDTVTLNEDNNWSETWEDVLTQWGHEYYSYAVREVNIPAGYKSSISYEYGKDTTTATITNTYDSNCKDEEYYIANVLQTDQISVSKTWDDNDNVLKERPDTLPVYVSDGLNNQYTVTLRDDESWHKEIQIPRVAGDKNYTAREDLSAASGIYEQTDSSFYIYENGADFYFTNSLQSTSITVKKSWHDGDVKDRPTSIQFKLQYKETGSQEWKDFGKYTMTQEDMGVENEPWTMVIDNLPADYQYNVVETSVYNGENPVNTYTAQVSKDESSGTTAFIITNTLNWSLKKTDFPEDGNEAASLSGAEFELKDQNGTTIAVGSSNEQGMVSWVDSTTNEAADFSNLNGTFKLKETKAPSGYQILQTEWTLTFDKGLLTNASGDQEYSSYISTDSSAANGVVITLKNGKLYELPETGGPGIFLYMIGGTLLLMAGSLMIYINRRRGVLKR